MIDIVSWNTFRSLHPHSTDAFQQLCRCLFAQKFGIASHELKEPNNYPGVECAPIKNAEDKWVSYQAKFSQRDDVNWLEFKKSAETTVKKIAEGKYNLDLLHIFTNGPEPEWPDQSTLPKKIAEIELILSKKNVQAEWHFGPAILEYLKSVPGEDGTHLRQRFFSRHDVRLLHPKPYAAQGIELLRFSQQRVSFVSRPVVSNALQRFIDSNQQVAWHVLVGQAGLGKSRCALEFCQTLDHSWYWGWVTDPESANWSEWVPLQNTLLVFDYVVGNRVSVANALKQLSRLTGFAAPKVRLLICERSAEPWLSELRTSIAHDWVSIEASRFGEPLEIPPLTPQEARELLENLGVRSRARQDQVIDVAQTSDAGLRPLTLQLLSLAEDRTNRPESLETLVGEYLKKQKQLYWGPAKVSSDSMRNAAVATLCCGVNANEAKQIPLFKSTFREADHLAVTGHRFDGSTISPMQPDVIGELFVLEHLLSGENPLDLKELKTCFEMAVAITQERVAGFLFRATDSFPAHRCFDELLQLPDIHPYFFSLVWQLRIQGLSKRKHPEQREVAFKMLNIAERKTQESTDPRSRLQYQTAYASCAQGMTFGYSAADSTQRERAFEVMRKLRTWIVDHNLDQLAPYYLGGMQNLLSNETSLGAETVKAHLNEMLVVARTQAEDVYSFWRLIDTKINNHQVKTGFLSGSPAFELFEFAMLTNTNGAVERERKLTICINVIKKLYESKRYSELDYPFSSLFEILDGTQSSSILSNLPSELFSDITRQRNGKPGYLGALNALEKISSFYPQYESLFRHFAP